MAKLAVPPSRELPAAKTNSAAGLGLACVVDATMPSHPEISHDDFLDRLEGAERRDLSMQQSDDLWKKSTRRASFEGVETRTGHGEDSFKDSAEGSFARTHSRKGKGKKGSKKQLSPPPEPEKRGIYPKWTEDDDVWNVRLNNLRKRFPSVEDTIINTCLKLTDGCVSAARELLFRTLCLATPLVAHFLCLRLLSATTGTRAMRALRSQN
jgi:hypothetical protein